jgi:hypothetical protein
MAGIKITGIGLGLKTYLNFPCSYSKRKIIFATKYVLPFTVIISAGIIPILEKVNS